jgi:galactokinase/mevalonate kinase-like predicted kinase
LGSSGSFTVCLINLILEFKKIKMNKEKIAELAWIIEKEKCRSIVESKINTRRPMRFKSNLFFEE